MMGGTEAPPEREENARSVPGRRCGFPGPADGNARSREREDGISFRLGSSEPVMKTSVALSLLALVLAACGTPAYVRDEQVRLASDDARIRVSAAKRLGQAGADARVAEVELREGLADEHPEVRRWCAYALGEITNGDRTTIRALAARLLEDEYAGARHAAAAALGRIGAPAATETDALLRAVEDESEAVRGIALLSLRKLAVATPDAVPALARMLSHPDARVRTMTAIALRKIGPDADAALGRLGAAAANDPDPNVRAAAEAAMRSIRGE